MVREFSVNSRSDLEEFRFGDIEYAEKFVDLDLSYMPEGSAFALAGSRRFSRKAENRSM